MPALDEETQPYVLKNTPPVLYVWLLCREYGDEFHWFPYQKPFMVGPEGNIIKLDVIDDLPHISLGAKPSDKGVKKTYTGWYHDTYNSEPGTRRAADF